MKAVRYIVGVIGFVLVWFVVAVFFVTLMDQILLPHGSGPVMEGIELVLRYLPGIILGLLAAIQSFRASIRDPKKQDEKS